MTKKSAGAFDDVFPELCADNPLLASIKGCPTTMQGLYDAIANLPAPPTAAERAKDKLARYIKLGAIQDIYIPSRRDLRVALTAIQMLVHGYVDRIPNAAYWRRHNAECAALASGTTRKKKRRRRCTAATSRAVIGVSGTGKSSCLDHLLAEIEQSCEHDQNANPKMPRFQLVWLKITCPTNQSPKAFIRSFFTQVDEELGTNFAAAHRRESIDELVASMGSVAREVSLGLLEIDEIQNAVCAKQRHNRRLLKLFVNITEVLGIPIIFVGTPKSQNVMNHELADARRMCGQRWEPYAANDPEWIAFLKALWMYLYTRSPTPLTETLMAKIHYLTQGIPALAKTLFVLTQERLILNSSRKNPKTRKEIITVNDLQATFDNEMISVGPAVEALRSGQGLEVFDDLLPKQLPKPKSWTANLDKIDLAMGELYESTMARAVRRAAKEHAAELVNKKAA